MRKLAAVLAMVCLFCAVLMGGPHKRTAVAAAVSIPNPLAFPDTEVGATSTVLTATFYSVGQAPLNLAQFQMPPDFQIAQNTCLVWIPVGKSCTISFVFRPTHTGSIGEDLFISGNMPFPFVQALLGNGIPQPGGN
jgi:hypothetical protein